MTPPPDDRPKRRDLRAVGAQPLESRPIPDDPAGPLPPPADAAASEDQEDLEERRRKRRKKRARRGRRGREEAAAPAPTPARARARHWGALAAFLLLVLLPFAAATAYLFGRAADQYHSEVAFSVRSEEVASAAAGVLGALTQIGGGASPDAAILYDYIRSPEIVDSVGADLDLRRIWSRPGNGWRDGDPVFALGDDPAGEALYREWLRMVGVSYDTSAGIIEVTARAFAPEDAQAIATAVLAESSALINRLSDQAREDAVRFAREELDEAEAHLAEMRTRLGDFRRRHSIVDPRADVAGQSGLLNALNSELAQALVERDVLTSYAAEGDQRVLQANRRIDAITERIEEERRTLGVTGVEGSLPDVIGRYEELSLDLEFANTAYTQTLAGYAAARAEARRQSRYLAAHIPPTLASTSLYPRRWLLAGLTGLFLLIGWGIAMLVYYNVRDSG
jgi:capsular polysaccharide transport system permease protein